MVDLSPGRYVRAHTVGIYVVDSLTDERVYVTWVQGIKSADTHFPVDWTYEDQQSCLLEVALLGGEVL